MKAAHKRFPTASAPFWLAVTALLVTPFILVEQWHGYFDYARRGIFEVVALLVFGTVLCRALWRGDRLVWTPGMTFVASFLLVAFAGCLLAVNHYVAFGIYLHWLGAGLWFFALVQILESPGRIRVLLTAMSMISLGIAGAGLAQVYVNVPFLQESSPPGSFLGNANWAAQVLTLSMPGISAMLLLSRRTWQRLLAGMALAVSIGFLVHAQSRACWLALSAQVVFLGLFIGLNKGHPLRAAALKRPFIASLLLSICAGLLIGGIHPGGAVIEADSTEQAPFRIQDDRNILVRLDIYENTMTLIGRYPLAGIGTNNFQVRFPESSPRNHERLFKDFSRPWHYAHNDWLQLWLELGLAFPLLCVYGGYIWLRRMRHLYELPKDRADDTWLWPLSLAALVGLAVNMLFSFPLYNAVPPFLIATHLAIVEHNGLAAGWPGARTRQCRASVAAGVIAGMLCLSALALLTHFYSRQFRAEELRLKMGEAEYFQNWQKVITLGNQIGERVPGRTDWMMKAAEAHETLAWEQAQEPTRAEAVTRHLQAALTLLNRQLEAYPHYTYPHYLKGVVLSRLERLPEAEAALNQSLRYYPDSVDALLVRYDVRLQMENWPGALEDLERMLELDPTRLTNADNAHVALLIQLRRYPDAIRVLDSLIVRQPDVFHWKVTRAWCIASTEEGRDKGRALLTSLRRQARTREDQRLVNDALQSFN